MALLRTLRIRNLVIIDDLAVDFGPGLNLLTGETGAGKSILVDALGLVSGDRADRSLVRSGAAEATVEALFEVEDDGPAAAWMRERGPAPLDDGQILVRRAVAADGSGGRVQVNGSPCTVGLLRELAEHLLELHGQHDPRTLLESERHLELLDDFGGHAAELERVGETYAAVAAAADEAKTLRERAGERAARLERAQATVRELEALAPQPDELEGLARESHVLRHAGRMAELLGEVVGPILESEPPAAESVARAASRAARVAELDPSLADAAERLRTVALELADAAGAFRDYRDRADFDPARLDRIEGRRAALERACQRHATDEAGLLHQHDAARAEALALVSLDGDLARAEERLVEAGAAYARAARALGGSRGGAARRLEAAVQRQFGALALDKASFRVALEPARGPAVEVAGGEPCPLGPRGAERAEFLIAANPGEPLRPLRQVASGGELSRVMLALHVVAESGRGRRVLVFDEIDSGVGGAVADAVGARLQRLAHGRQLLCVTHLPQVAAYADRHYGVRKRVASGRTEARVASLEGSARVEELARMLGGRRATPAARRHASDLLEAASRVAGRRLGGEA
jgi:DNA repair protein RecN (Recombination protein N)